MYMIKKANNPWTYIHSYTKPSYSKAKKERCENLNESRLNTRISQSQH